jgi:hypothetical protein
MDYLIFEYLFCGCIVMLQNKQTADNVTKLKSPELPDWLF